VVGLIKKLIRLLLTMMQRALIVLLPVRKKVIVFESSVGRSYSGNPKAIYEELIKQGLDRQFICVWSLDDVSIAIPGKCIKVRRTRLKYLYYVSVAGYWVMDSRHPYYIKKRKNTVFIQTWHGTPLKKLGLDMHVLNMNGKTNLDRYKKEFKKSAQSWDYLISQNRYSSKIFPGAFGYSGPIWEIGYPRNDVLVGRDNDNSKIESKRKLGFNPSQFVILYAPTWRDDRYCGVNIYTLDIPDSIIALANKFQVIVLIKAHYLVRTDKDIDFPNVRIFGNEVDVQALMLASDILITDYSSVMFDFSILKRPIVFYMYDYDHYETNLRGFYFDIRQHAPGPVATTEIQLIDSVSQILYSPEVYWKQYGDKYRLFCEKFNHADKGDAAQKVVHFLITGSIE